MNLLQKTKRNLNRRWAGEQYLSFLVFLLFRWVDENKILDKFLFKVKGHANNRSRFSLRKCYPDRKCRNWGIVAIVAECYTHGEWNRWESFCLFFFCTIHMIIIKCCSWYFYWGKIFERALELVSNEKRKTRRCVKGHVAIGGTLVFISSFFLFNRDANAKMRAARNISCLTNAWLTGIWIRFFRLMGQKGKEEMYQKTRQK